MARGDGGMLLAACLLLAGCKGEPPPPWPQYGPAPVAVELDAGSANGYALAALAASDALEVELPDKPSTNLTETERERFVVRLQRPLARLRQALQRPGKVRFAPRSLLGPDPRLEGFRRMGQALAWRAEQHVRGARWEPAVADVLDAVRLGCLLAGGDVATAQTGLWMTDRARAVIAPVLPSLSSELLTRLADGVWAALESKPLLETVYENERANALTTLDALQAAYRAGDLSAFEKAMGSDGADAVAKVEEFKPESAARKRLFDGIAAEITEEANLLVEMSRQPAAKRDPKDKRWKRSNLRPHRLFARHFILVGRGLLNEHDRSLARTRILAIEAAALARVKSMGRAPRDLAFVPARMRQDPFSGRDLLYRAVDRDYKAYSVGANFTDEQGDTNAAYESPDLRLERPLY